MIPVIALVGRPNVGKSTLFNQLTKSRDALVADLPGLTRDRQYGHGRINERSFIVIDTGGISGGEEGVDGLMAEQSMQAVDEADWVLFLVDARAGVTASDEMIAKQLRQRDKKIYLIANKIDGINPDLALVDFYTLGFGSPYPIAAAHGRGISRVTEELFEALPVSQDEVENEEQGIKLAVIGRPNVGKSTLVNRMLGEERVVVYDLPGTTRDSIYIQMERLGESYTLIDTAGVRKRGKVTEVVEKFSILKTLQAIEDSNVVIFVIDARENIADQDLKLLGFILDSGRSLVIAVNKWDGMDDFQKQEVRSELERRLIFVDFARIHFISALHGSGVGHLFDSVQEAFRSAKVKMSSSKLTRELEKAVIKHQPPLVRGRRIKLRYAHPGGHNPPIVVIHGNQVKSLPLSYQRFLIKHFRSALKIIGTPIRLELKEGDNPYKGKKNELTKRQVHKRRRMKKYLKKSKK